MARARVRHTVAQPFVVLPRRTAHDVMLNVAAGGSIDGAATATTERR